jgi:N-acetylglucosaminyldiphosphoundecaprenol N-acetyl-beta-D-mannosaminyltransferase
MSKQTQYLKVELLGLEVDALTITQAIDYIMERAGDRRAAAGYVVKPYVEFLDRATSDPALRQILQEAELALPDGVALLWAAHFLYAGPRSWRRFWRSLASIVLAPDQVRDPLPERIAGINFTWPLLAAAAAQGRSVFLIGKESAADIEATATVLKQHWPDLKIVGSLCGRDFSRPPGEIGEAWFQDTLGTLRHAQPDLVLVGMGFPLQERVIARLAPELAHGLLIGEGGTFDYEQFGGRRRKAPRLLQQLGLEWFWRLLLEPRRFRRQLAIPRVIWRIWRSR